MQMKAETGYNAEVSGYHTMISRHHFLKIPVRTCFLPWSFNTGLLYIYSQMNTFFWCDLSYIILLLRVDIRIKCYTQYRVKLRISSYVMITENTNVRDLEESELIKCYKIQYASS